jgi:hypothetical protein
MKEDTRTNEGSDEREAPRFEAVVALTGIESGTTKTNRGTRNPTRLSILSILAQNLS